MQGLNGEGIMVAASLLKRQKNGCGRNKALTIADRYRSVGCCFQLLYLLSATDICRKQENAVFDNAFYKAGCIIRIRSQCLTTQPLRLRSAVVAVSAGLDRRSSV